MILSVGPTAAFLFFVPLWGPQLALGTCVKLLPSRPPSTNHTVGDRLFAHTPISAGDVNQLDALGGCKFVHGANVVQMHWVYVSQPNNWPPGSYHYSVRNLSQCDFVNFVSGDFCANAGLGNHRRSRLQF